MGKQKKKYFTAKQRAALNRSIERNGEGPMRLYECRKVNNRGVHVCRNKTGYYLANKARRGDY